MRGYKNNFILMCPKSDMLEWTSSLPGIHHLAEENLEWKGVYLFANEDIEAIEKMCPDDVVVRSLHGFSVSRSNTAEATKKIAEELLKI